MEEQNGIFNQNLSLTTNCTLIVKQTGALTNNHNQQGKAQVHKAQVPSIHLPRSFVRWTG